MPDVAPPPAPEQAQLYDASGKPVDMTPDEAASAVSTGKAGFLKDSTVHLVTDHGVRQFSGADAPKMLQAGARIATEDEIHQAKVQAKYGGVGGQLMTGLLGAASGATLGISDALANMAGGQNYVEEHREANPLTFAGAQMAGAVAPMFIPGAEGAAAGEIAEGAEAAEGAGALGKAARAVSAPTRAVGRAGTAVEEYVAKKLGIEEGGSLVSALAKKAVAKGAGAATEGAILGAAQEADEQQITGDPDTNGQKLLAAVGHGALLGLATGGVLTAAGEIGSRVLGRAGPTLGRMAENEAFRSLNARKAFTNAADKIPGGAEGVGRELLDQGLVGFGDRVEDIAPKVAQARQEAGAKIGAILDAADQAGYEGPRINDVRRRIQSDVLPELQKLEGTNAGAIGKVQTLMDDLDHFAGIPRVEDVHSIADANAYAEKLENARLTFRQAQDFRARLDDTIRWATNPLAPVNEVTESMKKVRGILENELEESGEKAANKLGGSFKEEYRAAKLSYRRLTVADQAAQDAVERGEANRRISLTDYLGGDIASHALRGVGGGVIGGAAGAETGGGSPEGVLGGIATGALGALAHHAIRTRGNATAAAILDKIATLHRVENAVQRVDTQIDRGVGGFFRDTSRAPVKLRAPIEAAEGEHPAETIHGAVTQAVANHEQHIADIATAAAPIEAHAPQTSNSFQQAALRATTYLAQHAPQSTLRPSITPQFDKPQWNDAQRNDYQKLAQSIHDPMRVLDDMANGRVTRAQVDALHTIYPAIYADIVNRVHDRLADLKHPLTYDQKCSLSTLLGIAPDATFEPGFVSAMQGSYTQAAPQQQPPPGKGRVPRGTQRPLKGDLADDVSLAVGRRPSDA